MPNKLGYKRATLHPFTLEKEDKNTLPYCIKRKIVRKKRDKKGSCKSVFLLLIKCTLFVINFLTASTLSEDFV